MMEVHWGQKDVWRNTISTAQSPQTYHQSEFHRNNIFKAQSETFDLLCQVLEVWEVLDPRFVCRHRSFTFFPGGTTWLL